MTILERMLDVAALFFARTCHVLGAVVLRAMSTVVLVTGILSAVVLQMTAFYYRGVLNPGPLIACLLYLPSLGALGVLREEMLRVGVSRSGLGPARTSHAVALSYIVMIVAAFGSLFHPLWMREENYISLRSLWIAWAGTASFYYGLLVSEVLYAAAMANFLSGREDHEARRLEKYGAVPYADSDEASSSTPMQPPSLPVGAVAVPIDAAGPYSSKPDASRYGRAAIAGASADSAIVPAAPKGGPHVDTTDVYDDKKLPKPSGPAIPIKPFY
jgi:hypothetical protein